MAHFVDKGPLAGLGVRVTTHQRTSANHAQYFASQWPPAPSVPRAADYLVVLFLVILNTSSPKDAQDSPAKSELPRNRTKETQMNLGFKPKANTQRKSNETKAKKRHKNNEKKTLK